MSPALSTPRHRLPARVRPRLSACLLALCSGMPLLAQAVLPPCPAPILRAQYEEATDDHPEGSLQAVPANDVDCARGVPLAVEPGVTLWRCRVDFPEGDGPEAYEPDENAWSYAFLVVRDGQPTQAYRDDLMAGRYGAWHVRKVDLDGDGREERVVALWNTQGNGLGVNHWTVRVFSSDWRPLGESVQAVDWGPSSLVQAPSPRKGCDIAVTSWEEDHSTGTDGIALEARFLRLQGGRLDEAADRPPLRRRYTNAFQDERTAHFERDQEGLDGDVATWLRNAAPRP